MSLSCSKNKSTDLCQLNLDNAVPFTVFYIVGRPRTGSTFVGDWVARRLGILNAGEVWQTMRELEVTGTPTLVKGQDRWADPKARKIKRDEILADPLWSRVFAHAGRDAYSELIATARTQAQALVDCSKTDEGIERFRALGCKVVVIHTIRAFSTWSTSVDRYRAEYGLPRRSRLRLLYGYIRINRRLSKYKEEGEYHLVPQERLAELDEILPFAEISNSDGGRYRRHEMFGTPNFSETFSDRRATARVTFLDRLLYAAIGVTA